MKIIFNIAEAFRRWIDCVAVNVAVVLDRFSPLRAVALLENDEGDFVLQTNELTPGLNTAGDRLRFANGRIVSAASQDMPAHLSNSRVDLVLRPERFLVQSLELPRRASEFLDGIVRTQIDQLTPWSVGDVAFGWSKPIDAGTDRIRVTVAATALTSVTPYVEAFSALGVRSIAVFTSLAETGQAAVKVLERAPAATLQIGRIRRSLHIALLGVGLAVVVTVGASIIIAETLDLQEADLARRIAAARNTTGAARNAAGPLTTATLRALGLHKHDVPSTVIVLDALSQILPDHTYVTELRIDEGKVQLTGVTRDAPSLISLLEQSGRFTRATFFAPTTRVPSEPGERFHIEAHIQALASPHS